MSASAASACATLGLPLLRLARAGWSGRLDAGGWHWTGSTREAAGVAAALGSRVFLTSGRQTLGDFQPLEHRYALVRVVETPLQALPARWELVRDELVVSVADQGAGIPKKDLARVFERFYKVDKARVRGMGGTGLGLAIARHIAEGHGGRLWVESEEGRGSTFSVAIPLAR